MSEINVGWVGNYRRIGKRFDVAFHVCQKYGYNLHVAGPPHTILHRSHSDMPEFYRTKDILLVTSQREAHPLAVYESLACGTPVVMKRVGDCYAEGIPGIRYYDRWKKQDDVDSINQCIKYAFKNRHVMGNAGRRELVKRWQWKHWIPTYTAMFRALSGKKRRMKIAIVVDKPRWAWEIMAKIIRQKLSETGFYKRIDIVYGRTSDTPKRYHLNPWKVDDGYTFQPANYDLILNHHWQAYNHKTFPDFPHEKNIPCANGEAYTKEWKNLFNGIAENAVAITSVSKVIVEDLRRRFDKPVYHCSRGVDIEMFKP